jgi:toxin FitB
VYLLDTNVVSELRRAKPHGAVVAWLQNADENQLFLSAVTIGEIQAGIEVTRDQDASKAAELEAWLGVVASSYQVLAMDAACFRQWGKLVHRKSNTLLEDAIIAATAKRHKLTVVTRNTADFKALGVAALNPFKTLPR